LDFTEGGSFSILSAVERKPTAKKRADKIITAFLVRTKMGGTIEGRNSNLQNSPVDGWGEKLTQRPFRKEWTNAFCNRKSVHHILVLRKKDFLDWKNNGRGVRQLIGRKGGEKPRSRQSTKKRGEKGNSTLLSTI